MIPVFSISHSWGTRTKPRCCNTQLKWENNITSATSDVHSASQNCPTCQIGPNICSYIRIYVHQCTRYIFTVFLECVFKPSTGTTRGWTGNLAYLSFSQPHKHWHFHYWQCIAQSNLKTQPGPPVPLLHISYNRVQCGRSSEKVERWREKEAKNKHSKINWHVAVQQ